MSVPGKRNHHTNDAQVLFVAYTKSGVDYNHVKMVYTVIQKRLHTYVDYLLADLLHRRAAIFCE